MRLNKFESAGVESLGEGEEKRTFVNPEDERKIISETKEDVEKDTPRQLKGGYHLTKIAHLLLPKNIPDIYQAGESADGKQAVDRERISHTQGKALLQEARRSGGDEEPARKQIIEELGGGMGKVDLELERIGLGFNIDGNVGNYTKDEAGNVYYLETFKPWRTDISNPKELEALFDEEELQKAIDSIPDKKTKEKCTQHLERLQTLLEEEKRQIQETQGRLKENLIECDSHIEEIEAIFAPFATEEALATLSSVQTEEEAENSKERKSANEALALILEKLRFLEDKTNIAEEKYGSLYEKYKTLSRAVGMINGGLVDHER